MANHPVLSKSIEQCGAEKATIFCGMHRENTAEHKYLFSSIGNLVLAGLRSFTIPTSTTIAPSFLPAITGLPKYPYLKKRHWSEAAWHTAIRTGKDIAATPLGGTTTTMTNILQYHQHLIHTLLEFILYRE